MSATRKWLRETVRHAETERRRVAAIVLVAVPATVLLSFAIGEMVAGDISGAQHLPEGGALLVLVAAGWHHPRVAGTILLVGGVAFLGMWLLFVLRAGEPDLTAAEILIAASILFLPPLLAGWLFLGAARVS